LGKPPASEAFLEPVGRPAATPVRQRFSNFKTNSAPLASKPAPRSAAPPVSPKEGICPARREIAAARMLNSITNMGKKTKK